MLYILCKVLWVLGVLWFIAVVMWQLVDGIRNNGDRVN